MKRNLAKILKGFTTAIVVLAVVFVALTSGARVFGVEPLTVLSGSMEPELKTGSIVYIKPTEDTENFKVGDVITFKLSSGTIATHRIIEIVEKDGAVAYRTKGDSNPIEDGGAVKHTDIIGTPVFSIPFLGFVAAFIVTKVGRLVAVFAGLGLIALTCFADLLTGKKVENDNSTEERNEVNE